MSSYNTCRECPRELSQTRKYDMMYHENTTSLYTKKGFCSLKCMEKNNSKKQCHVCFKYFELSPWSKSDWNCSPDCEYKFYNQCTKCANMCSKNNYQTIPRRNMDIPSMYNRDGLICENCMLCEHCGKKGDDIKWISSMVFDSTKKKLLKAGYLCSKECQNMFESKIINT